MTLPLRWYLTQLLQKYTLHFDKIYRSREINRVTKITMFWKPQSVNFGPLQSTSEFCVHLVRSWWEKGEGFLKRSLVEGKERSGRGGRDRIAGRKKEGVERVEGECRNLEPGSVRHKIKGCDLCNKVQTTAYSRLISARVIWSCTCARKWSHHGAGLTSPLCFKPYFHDTVPEYLISSSFVLWVIEGL